MKRRIPFARTQHAPVTLEVGSRDFLAKYAKRIRVGKTRKDRLNGNPQRSIQRRQARATWVQETRGRDYKGDVNAVPAFPV